jgi:DNA-binding transcriptional MocR family regulator
MKLCEMSREEIKAVKQQAEQKYNEFKAQGLKLDMSRGKPSPEQLDLTMDMLNVLNKDNLVSESGMDCRNYGGLDGIPEAKKLLAPMVGADESNVIVFGNSSLNIMFWVMQLAFTHGVLGGKPFSQAGKLKFLCPVPGYDRHFAITEFFGFEMINIPMNEDGPDMDMIESLVSEDESIKGIWCVPQYSNPTGISFSDEVVKRFAALKPKSEDFRIYWDNAYTVHYLTDDHSRILNILDEAKKVGNENIVYVFGSTSKITFPGAGVALMAASDENIKSLKKALGFATISYDKLNQMRHAVYFDGKFENLEKHMDLHAKSLAPKFARVLEVLDREIAPLGIGTYTRPKGGYFISFDSLPGCAKRIAALAKEAGVVLTPAGSAFPYGKDENDTNIRIAPSYPTIEDLTKALEVFCECIKIASCEKLLAE